MEISDILGATGIFILCLSVSSLTMYFLHKLDKLDKRDQERHREKRK